MVVDRRQSDPRDGALSREALDAAHRALGGDEAVAVAVVLQRLGTGRLFACRRCGELARCSVCGQGEEEFDGQLACAQRHALRANFCQACGATNLRRVRVGVTTLARDVAAQAYEAGIKQRIVIVEFESVAKAVEAHDSPEYQAALKAFDGCAERDLRIVEGLE